MEAEVGQQYSEACPTISELFQIIQLQPEANPTISERVISDYQITAQS